MSKPIPAGNIPQRKKSISKSSAAKGRKDSLAVQVKRHKEERSRGLSEDNSGLLDEVYKERKRRVGRLHKVTQLPVKRSGSGG
jgi:hypothetical protein